jgi:hypothetical protein
MGGGRSYSGGTGTTRVRPSTPGPSGPSPRRQPPQSSGGCAMVFMTTALVILLASFFIDKVNSDRGACMDAMAAARGDVAGGDRHDSQVDLRTP